MKSLKAFLQYVGPGIESITGNEEDIASFMKMMRIFNEVNISFMRY